MNFKKIFIFIILIYFVFSSGKYIFLSNFKDFGYFYVHAHSTRLFQNPYIEENKNKIFNMADYPHTVSVAHYPPFLFMVLSPLTRLDFYPAARGFFIFNVALYLCAVFLTARREGEGLKRVLIFFVFLIPDFVWTNLAAGQVNIMTLFFILLAKYFYDKKISFAAGAALAAASIIKIIPALFLIPFILKKDFKVVLWFVTVILIFILIPEVFLQRGITADFIAASASKLSSDSLSAISYSLPAFFTNYFSSSASMKIFYIFVFFVFLDIVVFYGGFFKNKKISDNLFYCVFPLLLLFSTFVSKQHYIFLAPFYAYFLCRVKNKYILFFTAFSFAVIAAPVEFAGIRIFPWIKYFKMITVLITFILVFYIDRFTPAEDSASAGKPLYEKAADKNN